MNYLGDFVGTETVPIFFNTFDANGASVTLTGLAVTDIEVYKDGGVTQRASDAGYTLLDTDGIDFDSLVGIHGFSIDLSDNTDAGFFVAGSDYTVVVSAVTVDSQAVSFVAASFSIQNRYTRGTDSAATAAALTTVDTVVDGIKAVTDNLPNSGALTDLATATALATVDANVDAVLVDTGTTLPAQITALNNLSASDVNAQVVDVLRTDTISEVSQAAPPAAPTTVQMINYLYREWVRNRVVVDATASPVVKTVYADDGTTELYKKNLTDSASVLTQAEAVTGV